jgi:hypothetical protein
VVVLKFKCARVSGQAISSLAFPGSLLYNGLVLYDDQ